MRIEVSPEHLKRLSAALLGAFDHEALTRVVRTRLGLDLEWVTPVAGKRDLTTVVSDLVAYFASLEDGLKLLLEAAREENPGNAALNTLAADWSDLAFNPHRTTQRASGDGARCTSRGRGRRRLRKHGRHGE